jgi:hypothetical protein
MRIAMTTNAVLWGLVVTGRGFACLLRRRGAVAGCDYYYYVPAGFSVGVESDGWSDFSFLCPVSVQVLCSGFQI